MQLHILVRLCFLFASWPSGESAAGFRSERVEVDIIKRN